MLCDVMRREVRWTNVHTLPQSQAQELHYLSSKIQKIVRNNVHNNCQKSSEMFIRSLCCWFVLIGIGLFGTGNTLVEETNGKTIVAFGDSLTEGFWKKTIYQPLPEFHSYAITLQNLLKNKSNLVQVGISGERTVSMINRLPIVLQKNPETKLVMILVSLSHFHFILSHNYCLFHFTLPLSPPFYVVISELNV